MPKERVQKILARAGYGSRRSCEKFIKAGRVRVNGRVIKLGQAADTEKDQIFLDNQLVHTFESIVYIALHKPRGVISSTISHDHRQTVCDLVGVSERCYPVGRLDADSEGLIILTNDGDLTHHITHPKYGHEKEYRVLVGKRPDSNQLKLWRKGIILDDGYKTRPSKVWIESKSGKGAWLRVVLKEGRSRQIRKTGILLGIPILHIIRVRIGKFRLGGLKPGEWKHLSTFEVSALQE